MSLSIILKTKVAPHWTCKIGITFKDGSEGEIKRQFKTCQQGASVGPLTFAQAYLNGGPEYIRGDKNSRGSQNPSYVSGDTDSLARYFGDIASTVSPRISFENQRLAIRSMVNQSYNGSLSLRNQTRIRRSVNLVQSNTDIECKQLKPTGQPEQWAYHGEGVTESTCEARILFSDSSSLVLSKQVTHCNLESPESLFLDMFSSGIGIGVRDRSSKGIAYALHMTAGTTRLVRDTTTGQITLAAGQDLVRGNLSSDTTDNIRGAIASGNLSLIVDRFDPPLCRTNR